MMACAGRKGIMNLFQNGTENYLTGLWNSLRQFTGPEIKDLTDLGIQGMEIYNRGTFKYLGQKIGDNRGVNVCGSTGWGLKPGNSCSKINVVHSWSKQKK